MKIIKMTIRLILSMTIIIVLNQGCKKYEEGPMISLRSKTERVANTWKVEKYIKNGVDETADRNSKKINYIETFTKDGVWSYSYTADNGDYKADVGKWEFDKNSKKKEIDRNAGGSTWEELHILKLKEKEFWFWYMDSGDKKEFHLIPN